MAECCLYCIREWRFCGRQWMWSLCARELYIRCPSLPADPPLGLWQPLEFLDALPLSVWKRLRIFIFSIISSVFRLYNPSTSKKHNLLNISKAYEWMRKGEYSSSDESPPVSVTKP